MKIPIVENKWEYEIHDIIIPGNYGFKLIIYKNKQIVYTQSGFGSIQSAEITARHYFLQEEFNIEIGLNNE